MTDRRWTRGTAVLAALVLSAGCVGDRLPDLDRLGVTRSENGEATIVFQPCNGEKVEKILVRRSDSNFETRGDIIWEIESGGGTGSALKVAIGDTPDGFSTVTQLTEEIRDDDPILVRVTTEGQGVIPMSLRLEQLRTGEILSRQDTYQTSAAFEKSAKDACG